MNQYELFADTIKHRKTLKSYRRWVKADLPDWSKASCLNADPELFFIERYETNKHGKAKQICASCPIKVECLQYALKYSMNYGIWGGTAPKERFRLKKTLVYGGHNA